MQQSFDDVIAMKCALQNLLKGIAVISDECSWLNSLHSNVEVECRKYPNRPENCAFVVSKSICLIN